MFTELVYDAHIGAWTYFDVYNDPLYYESRKYNVRSKAQRSGFYPYEYNFLFGRRDGLVQCSYCGKFFITRQISRDHVYPKSRGGQVTTPACYECNERKADLLPIAWALKLSGVVVIEEEEPDEAAVA